MKKPAIALLLVLAAIGCAPQNDSKFAFQAPGTDQASPAENSQFSKPMVPAEKPDLRPPIDPPLRV